MGNMIRDTNEWLALTMKSLRYTSFNPHFGILENQSIDAPEFFPIGSTQSVDGMTIDNVVNVRPGYGFKIK